MGSDCFRFRLAAIEPAHGVGANGPRSDLGRRDFFAFARTLVDRADQAAFDQNVRALADVVEHVLRKTRAEDRNPVPLGLRDPFVFSVFPGALRGDRKHGELRAVALGLALFGIGSDESYECYGIEVHVFLLFLPHFPEAPQSEGRCSQGERLHSGRDPTLGRNRESRRREAAGRRNWPEAVPRKSSGGKRSGLPRSGTIVMRIKTMPATERERRHAHLSAATRSRTDDKLVSQPCWIVLAERATYRCAVTV